MGYVIEYDTCAKRYEVRDTHPARFLLLLTAALILFSVLTVRYWPEGREVLRSVLIPGEDAVTVQAVKNMTMDLKAGASIGDAVEAFCMEVIQSGNDSD